MPVVAESSSYSTTIGEHIRTRRPRSQTSRHIRPISADDPPLTHVVSPAAQPTRLCKSAMSSFLLVPTSNETSLPVRKKPIGFPQTASFRGLGCTAGTSQQVSVPSLIRASAEWGEAKKVKYKKKNSSKKKNNGGFSGGSIKTLSETRGAGIDGGGCVTIPDVWCGPGIGFSTDAVVGGSVDSVVSGPPRRNVPARRKIDGDRTNSSNNNNSYSFREISSVLPRRSLYQELPTYWDSDSTFVTSRTEPMMFSNRHHRHFRHPSPEGLAEIMMLQNGFVMGGVLDSHDHLRGLRLDVDNMSYEQLLELSDRIGYVNTGLKEEEMNRCLRINKPPISDTPTSNSASLADKKCSICQEEYETNDETGKLKCGHSFHVECVKQWLSRKNSCPVCKTAAHIRS